MSLDPLMTPGKQVTIRVRNPLWNVRDRYASGVIREFQDYTGTVHPLQKWQQPGRVVNLTTDLKFLPFREIALVDVVSVDGVKQKPQKIAEDRVRHWKVTGSKGDIYTVTEVAGSRTCTCAGFTFRRACRHISGVR